MEVLNSNITDENMFNPGNSQIFELVTAQLQGLKPSELLLVYEMIHFIKRPKEVTKNDKSTRNFPFVHVQEALKGISGNLSDDIIDIDRGERL